MSQERVGILIEIENFKNSERQLQSLDDLLDALREGLKLDVQMDTSRAQQQTRKLRQEAMSLKDVYNSIVVSVLHMGSAMQSAGNALTKLSNPFRSLMRSTVFAAGFKAFGKISEGFDSGFDRYDTIKQYNLVMAEYAKKNYSVEQSTQDLIKSVKGLPTGLDEIASLAQRYTLSLGDMEEGTQLAIATNNAFMASMATESQRYQGMMQLQDLLNGKNLNSREWMSLGASMGKAINEVGKELGYGADEMGLFRQQLYGGKISTEEFLSALKKVGTGEGSIAKLAANVKVTWGAVFSNLKNAFSRMTQGILETLDTLSEERFGKSLPIVLAEQLDKIDQLTAKMKQYILDHKDVIFDFMDQVKGMDWAGIGKSFMTGLETIAKGLKRFVDILPGDKMLKTYAYLLPIASVLGKFLTISGGLIKGSRHLLGGLGTGFFVLFRGLMSITGIKGFRKAPQALETIGEVGKAAGKVNGRMPKIKTLMTGFKRNLIGLGNFAIEAVKIGAIIGGAVLAVRAVKDILTQLKEISYLSQEVDWRSLGEFATPLIIFVGAVATVGGAWGKTGVAGFKQLELGVLAIGAVVTTILGFAWLDSKLIEGTLKNFSEACKALNSITDEVNALSTKDVNVNKVGGLLRDLYEVYKKLNPSSGDSLGSISKNESDRMETIFKNLKESLEHAGEALDAIDKIQVANFDVLRTGQKIQGIVALMGTLYNAMGKYFGETQNLHSDVGGNTVTSLGVTKDAVTNVERAVAIFDHLSGVIGKLKPLTESIAEMADVDTDKVEENMEKVNKTMKAVFDNWGELTGADWFKKIKNAEQDALNIQGLADAIHNFKEVLNQFRILMLDPIFTGAAGSSDPINRFTVEKITGIKDSLSELATNLNGLVNPSTGIQRLASLSEAIDSLSSLFNQIAGFESPEGLTEGVEAIKEATEQIKTALDELFALIMEVGSVNGEGNGSVNMEIKIKGRVTGTEGIVRDIRSAKTKINSAVNSLPSKFTKQIAINFSATISGASKIASRVRAEAEKIRNSVLYSSGGGYVKPVYLASGGSPWRPRGTDTVPAMLTPGEFVMRRSAVNAFGVDFMKRLNAMDIDGAMRSISARVGRNMGYGSVVNNTYNNNAVINQYITHPTQDFTYRRANRYVGAL